MLLFPPPAASQLYLGYKTISPDDIVNFNAEVVLVTTLKSESIITALKQSNLKNSKTKIEPLIKENIGHKLKKYLLRTFNPPIRDFGTNNKIILIKANGQIIYNPKPKGLYVTFWGDNNVLEIKEPLKYKRIGIGFKGSDSRVILEQDGVYKKLDIAIGNSSNIYIGKKTTIENASIYASNQAHTLTHIGDDCMISYDVLIKPTDSHTIYDIDTMKVVNNKSKEIKIGNHVWIGARCTILKGTQIPDNCVIGAASLLSKEYTVPNSIIAGTPAQIIKNNINWDERGIES